MALHTLFALAATLTGNNLQDPSMDLQIAMPVGDPNAPISRPAKGRYQVPTTSVTTGTITTSDQTVVVSDGVVVRATNSPIQTMVSASFTKVAPSEVLTWLQGQEVSFVINEGDLMPDTKVTLNLKNVPLDDAIDALGSALGGFWERKNRVRVFHRGLNPMISFNGFSNPAMPPMPTTSDFRAMPDMPAMPPEAMAALKALDSKDIQIKVAKALDAAKLAEKSAGVAAKSASKAQTKAFKVRSDVIDSKAIQKEITLALEAVKTAPHAQTFTLKGAPAQVVKTDSVSTTSAADLDKLFRSLTIAQKDSIKKSGHLRYHELSKQQREWLGIKPSTKPGSWTITVKVNQNELTVKN